MYHFQIQIWVSFEWPHRERGPMKEVRDWVDVVFKVVLAVVGIVVGYYFSFQKWQDIFEAHGPLLKGVLHKETGRSCRVVASIVSSCEGTEYPMRCQAFKYRWGGGERPPLPML